MKTMLYFDECVKDSPSFRELLHNTEADSYALEACIEKVLKQCSYVNDVGRNFNSANVLLMESIKYMQEYFKEDEFVKNVLGQFAHVLSEICSFNTILDRAQRSITSQMSHFLKTDIKGNQELKKMFDKCSSEYDAALSKQAGVSRYKPHEIDDAEASLATHKTTFRKVSMEYVFQLNMLHENKKLQAVDKISSYMHALHTFFHQGYELFKETEPFLKQSATRLDECTQEVELKRKDMLIQRERYQAMAGDNSMFIKESGDTASNIIEGYLFKRGSNAFKTWSRPSISRRWFSVYNNKLQYQSKLKSHHQEDTMIVVDDLRLCSIRIAEESERRFCFEVLSPTKTFLLQAESEDVRQAWIHSIQSSISEAYKNTMEAPYVMAVEAPPPSSSDEGVDSSKSSPAIIRSSPSISSVKNLNHRTESSSSLLGEPKAEDKQSILQKIKSAPGNNKCADCKKHEARWASVNLGIVLCIECSGVHRSLGVHVSKVRSLTLDSWEPEVVAIMLALGNDRVNEIYEANVTLTPIKPGCTNRDRSDYIQAKYVRREFCATLSGLTGNEKNPGKKIRRWKIRKSKPRKRLEKSKKAESISSVSDEAFVADSTNAVDSLAKAEKVAKEADNETFVFGISTVPDPDGESEVENSDVEEINNLNANILFYKAAKLGNLPVLVLARSNGADINWCNPQENRRTALMQASSNGSIAASEYLLLNSARINMIDADGRSPLHYAALSNNTGIACQLLKRKAIHGIQDKQGKTALQIAIDAANADIVTLIRLKQMNDEMMDTDPTSMQNALVTDVFRDFSHRAASNDLPSPNPVEALSFKLSDQVADVSDGHKKGNWQVADTTASNSNNSNNNTSLVRNVDENLLVVESSV